MARPKKKFTSGNVPNKADQIKEILKCGKDPAYFIKNYVKISHPVKGPIPFKLFPYQETCLKAMQDNRFCIANKSRQLGLSTLAAAFSLWMGIFQREKHILCIATKLDTAKTFLKKVNGMYDSLPGWLVMPEIKARSVKYIEFSNGSKIQAIPTGASAGRGESVSYLIIDEAAHIEDIDDLWIGLLPVLNTGGSAMLISSPSGVGTLFHKIWVGAKDGIDGKGNPYPGDATNDFYRVELPWWVHPEHDQEWFENEAAQIRPAKGEAGVKMELCAEFISSGEAFISQEIIDFLEANQQEPIGTYGPRGEVWIWKYAQPGHKYIMSADISRGNSSDFSVFHVFDIKADEVVCEFQGKISPEDMADLMADIGSKYNTALICPELNSFGLLTAKRLKDIKYPNLFYEKLSRNIYQVPTEQDIRDELPGVTTGPKNRDEMLAKLESTLRKKSLKIYSKRFTNEIKTFVWRGMKAQAMKGYHDDLVMCLAIGLNLFEVSGTNVWGGEEVATAMMFGMSKSVNTLNPGNKWANTQSYAPPIMTSSGLKTNTHIQDLQAKKEASQQGPQDVRNPYWAQWGWVLGK